MQLITVTDCQPTPSWIITGQGESQHVHLGHATDPEEPNTIRNLHVCKHKAATASLWMPDLQSGAQSLLLCSQAPCTEGTAATEQSYVPSSTFPSKPKPEHTWQMSWASMRKILTKKLIWIPTSLLSISSRVKTAKIHSPTCVALHMPHPSPETPVSLSISQSMAFRWATQI